MSAAPPFPRGVGDGERDDEELRTGAGALYVGAGALYVGSGCDGAFQS